MTSKIKAGLGIAGICVLAIGISATTTHSAQDEMNIMTEGGIVQLNEKSSLASVKSSGTISVSSCEQTEKISVQHEEQQNDINIHVTFTSFPDEKRSSETELVFISDSPQTIIIVPTAKEYSVFEEYNVAGYIEEMTDNVMYLSDCEIQVVLRKNEPTADTSAPETTYTPERSPLPERNPTVTSGTSTSQSASSSVPEPIQTDTETGQTVYVSSTGKYHNKPTCSGMKSYTEMAITHAKANGHQPCKKCFK